MKTYLFDLDGTLLDSIDLEQAEAKFAAMEDAGIHIVRSPAEMGSKMLEVLG